MIIGLLVVFFFYSAFQMILDSVFNAQAAASSVLGL
jgi:hypothetical protein